MITDCSENVEIFETTKPKRLFSTISIVELRLGNWNLCIEEIKKLFNKYDKDLSMRGGYKLVLSIEKVKND